MHIVIVNGCCMKAGLKPGLYIAKRRRATKGVEGVYRIHTGESFQGHAKLLHVEALRNLHRRWTSHVPISIKNAETEQLARELAKETGETITEVIKRSLQDRLQRVRGRRHARGLPEQVEDILQRMDALPTLDERAEDEILGYDQDSIPASSPKDGSSGGH